MQAPAPPALSENVYRLSGIRHWCLDSGGASHCLRYTTGRRRENMKLSTADGRAAPWPPLLLPDSTLASVLTASSIYSDRGCHRGAAAAAAAFSFSAQSPTHRIHRMGIPSGLWPPPRLTVTRRRPVQLLPPATGVRVPSLPGKSLKVMLYHDLLLCFSQCPAWC